MAPTRKSYVSLTSTQKFKLLEDIKNGMKQADAARKYSVLLLMVGYFFCWSYTQLLKAAERQAS